MPARTPGAIHTNERAGGAARRLRREPTHAERMVWKALRQLKDFHFRRQAPIGPYVVDFACHRSRLVVEVDGGIHRLDVVVMRDAERDAWLKERGYRVVRIPNATAIVDTDGAIAAILPALALAPPPPTPPRKGEGS